MWRWVCSTEASSQLDIPNGTGRLVNCDNVLNTNGDVGSSPVKKTKISANTSDLSS